MDEKLPGVRVPTAIIEALDAAGDDAPRSGWTSRSTSFDGIRSIAGVSGST